MKEQRNTSNTRYKLRLLRFASLYSVIMLALVIAAMYFAKDTTEIYVSNSPSEGSAQTEYVYVKIGDNSGVQSDSASESTDVYTAREYMGKVGIFLEDGTLFRVIDVYVKNLPEADRRLLGEGIEIVGKKQLNEIIQDYGG